MVVYSNFPDDMTMVQASTDLLQWLDTGEATADETGTFEFVDE